MNKVSSHGINRMKFEQKIAEENAGIAQRILAQDKSGRSKPRGQDPRLPAGWTRGVGGRLLPPVKQRWGTKKFDAGEWNS